jgi:multidrug efflux pump subunit AcrA (membrane-fusion protein)
MTNRTHFAMMKRSIASASLSLLALGGGIYAVDAHRSASTVVLDGVGVKNLRIETAEVEETEFEETIFSLGRVEAIAAKRSGVSSRIAGRIVELKPTVGDTVEAGQEVARLESRQPGDPPPVITLKTSAGGLVTKVSAAVGEPLEPEAVLMEITDLSEVHAVARVPEHLAGGLKPGAVAHIRVAALPDEKFDGELMRFGTEADRESGTIDAIFKLPNPNLTIRPGMRAEFSIVLNKREGVMVVPRSALQGDAANRYVYAEDLGMLDAREKKLQASKDLPDKEILYGFVKTPVVVGQINDRFAEIQSGLLLGDSIVVQGAYSLAFAGGGTMSLREALDAAHGHEHNEDGSEKTPEQKKSEEAAAGHAHEHDHADGSRALPWQMVSAVLAVLLVVALLRGRQPPEEGDEENKPADHQTF